MWPDLRKHTFHAHNSMTHFSPLNDSCIRWLTIQASIDAESCLGWFCCGLSLRLVRCPRVLGSPSSGSISLGKQTAGCNSPHDWLMSFAMDYLLFVICGGENGTNWCHFAGFSEDVAFARHFVATRPPFHPVGVLLVLAMPVKNYLKWRET